MFKPIRSLAAQMLLCCTLTFLALIFTSTQASAQLNDPLNRGSERWKKLVENVNSQAAWESYFEKKWAVMTADEKKKVETWKSLILTQNTGNNGGSGGGKDPNEEKEENWELDKARQTAITNYNQEKAKERDKYFEEMLANILQEPAEITELKSNINENFVIIDMLYAEEFEKLGEKYISYSQAHPTGKFDKIKWIDEQDKKLVLLKKQYVAQMKEKAFSAEK